VADVDDYRHPRVRLSQRHRLRLTQFSPLTFVWLHLSRLPVRELYEIKRKVAFAPDLAPSANHQRKECSVLISAPRVALALIPNCTANRVWRQWCNHRVIKHVR